MKMDLNNINTQPTDSMDLFTKTSDISDLEPIDTLDTSDDKDTPLDPSSFVLLFTDLMQKTPVKDEIKADGSDQEQITVTETPSDVKEQLPLDMGTANDKTVNDTEHLVSDNSPISSSVDLQPTPELPLDIENNVAIAWINAENFQPPQATFKDTELNDELKPALTSELVQPDEMIDKILKKGVNSTEETINDLLKKEPVLPEEVVVNKSSKKEINLPVAELRLVDESNDVKVNVNFKEDILKNFNLPDAELTLATAQITTPSLRQNIQIDGPVLENIQNVVQSNVLVNNDQPDSIAAPVLKSLEIPVDINNPQWADKFAQQIIWLGHQNIKSALIKIHPEDLGPLEISINVIKDTATVNINTHSSEAHALIDQTIPKLREMMAEQGLNLSEVNIGSESNSRQSEQNSRTDQDTFNVNGEEDILLTTPLTKKIPKGLIDYFA